MIFKILITLLLQHFGIVFASTPIYNCYGLINFGETVSGLVITIIYKISKSFIKGTSYIAAIGSNSYLKL